MLIYRLFAIATITIGFTATAFAASSNLAVSPAKFVRQSNESYFLGDLTLAPGQWRIQEAPSGGYRIISDKNAEVASFTLSDSHSSFLSFQTVVQFNDNLSEINGVWGWINAYSSGKLLSSEYFGGHSWSQAYERQTVIALIPLQADRIEIVPRTNLGYTAFSYSASTVPEPSSLAFFISGIILLGFFGKARLFRD